tara:strand:+ start:13228 stop:14733 length:1506 start_codon:yes stop_codon:yes gene_type:complete
MSTSPSTLRVRFHSSALCAILLLSCVGASVAGPTVQEEAPLDPVQVDEASTAGTTQEATGPLPLEPHQVARCPGHELTRADFEEALIWRKALAPEGRETLRGMLEVQVLAHLALERGIVATPGDVNERIALLERQIIGAGEAESITQYLEANGIEPATFREYMRLALVHEMLTRHGLKLDEDAVLTGEMQTTWLEGEIDAMGSVPGTFPYTDTPVVIVGGTVAIERDEFAEALSREIPIDEQRKLCYEMLLARKVQERVPDLTDEAVERAMDEEVERRRERAAADPTYRGVKYEELLKAQGLSIAALRRDPAIRVSALAHLFVDRTHPGEQLLRAYLDEREFFDGLFGEGVEVYALMLNAARFANDLVPRDFEQAEAELEALKPKIENLRDFQRMVELHSEDAATREQKGLLGLVTRGALNVPETMRTAVFEILDASDEDPAGTVVGPVRLQGGVVLMALGERRPAPTWETMQIEVHRELRRRLISEALPPETIVTRFDPE